MIRANPADLICQKRGVEERHSGVVQRLSYLQEDEADTRAGAGPVSGDRESGHGQGNPPPLPL